MTMILRVLIALVALANLAIGLLFLFRPNEAAARFALMPLGIQGLATIRADFPAFFLTGGLFALIGGWRTSARSLLIPITLLGIALFGRCVSLVLDGYVATAVTPMIVELTMLAVLLSGWQQFRARPPLR